ncbi:polysaccharide pyruvyl transferase family protein [Gracilimonas mengyeensis]|uniref:Polysaccharide pyruvyl transferase n=1 Tax=Gracilimonas mengyeensis TaxID=1302730 RepID=A0A521FMS4_9BACT|nr:polysaccharide pyruvyl transferase family protein [Gracilimonas mengyeensis]SMO96761.1 Polysaccharide pyruvyl transferase [Gracilimonas mengyeensis]
MKVIILTFYKANNYGALLQCYALSQKVKEYGHEVELLDIPLKKDSKKKFGIKGKVREWLIKNRTGKFRKKYLPDSSKVFDEVSLKQNYPEADLYIVGSDQVWNYDITKEDQLLYYFNFLKNNEKRISYAASFGLDEKDYNPSNASEIRDHLKKFSGISIREEVGVNICKSFYGIQSVKVLDPVFLLRSYDFLLENKKENNKKTIVSYKYSKNEKWYDDLHDLSQKMELKPISLNDIILNKNIKAIPFPTVEKWVTTISNASFVITDSFHCMVFAILFKKDFVVLPSSYKRSSRMKSLLSDLGLSDRYFQTYEEVVESKIWEKKINYPSVFSKIEDLRKDSINFLEKFLK